MCLSSHLFFFFFNDTATTQIYTLSLHDALPISTLLFIAVCWAVAVNTVYRYPGNTLIGIAIMLARSEEHTSELQSPCNLVCRLLLEKKNKKEIAYIIKNKKKTKRKKRVHITMIS